MSSIHNVGIRQAIATSATATSIVYAGICHDAFKISSTPPAFLLGRGPNRLSVDTVARPCQRKLAAHTDVEFEGNGG